jgi:hypothetical protein
VAASGDGAFARIVDELGAWMLARGIERLDELRGRAHRARGGAAVPGTRGSRETRLPPVPGWRPREG